MPPDLEYNMLFNLIATILLLIILIPIFILSTPFIWILNKLNQGKLNDTIK